MDDKRFDYSDRRFDFSPVYPWRKNGKTTVLSSEYVEVTKPDKYTNLSANPSELQFSLEGKKMPTLFTNMSRFRVTGIFETRDTATAAWKPCPAAEYANVSVCPNWFELLIRNQDLFHDNYHVKIHDEPMYVSGHLNQYLYQAMDDKLKKFLCPEPCHPGNSVTMEAKKWTYADNSEWQKYSKHIFTQAPVTFMWIPLFGFPFFQGSNHTLDAEQVPKCLPVNHVGGDKLVYRIKFVDNWDSIFRRKTEEGAVKQYRFRLTDMTLMLEQVRMNPSAEARLFKNSKAQLSYHGVTKIARVENIPDRTMAYKLKFNGVTFPESMLIFALPKSVVGGTYKYSEMEFEYGPFYLEHNIKKVKWKYGEDSFSPEEPQLGDVTNEYMDYKFLTDDTVRGPFGLKLSGKSLNLRTTKSGHSGTDFPHLHFSFTTDGSRGRIVPQLCDSGVYNKPKDLSVSLVFSEAGSAKEAQYFVYLAYTDTNVVLDLKTKKFLSPYGLK